MTFANVSERRALDIYAGGYRVVWIKMKARSPLNIMLFLLLLVGLHFPPRFDFGKSEKNSSDNQNFTKWQNNACKFLMLKKKNNSSLF